MSISITIDNDRITAGIQSLIEDETAGVQTPATVADTGNEIDVTLSNPVGGNLGGFQAAFNTYLNGLVLSDAQKLFAAANDGASSSADFVKVTASNGETVSDLFFSDSAGAALDGDAVAGMFTLAGEQIYLWSSGDFCIATTSSVSSSAGRIVAAFYLNDTDANHQSRLNGNSSSVFQGGFYFPSQQVTFNGTTGMQTNCLQLVARIVVYSGDMNINNSCPANSGAHAFDGKKVRLVE